MSGWYVYCRSWTGFTDEFPFYDELNALPDGQLAVELEAKAITWLRENKLAVRRMYREAKAKLQRMLDEPLPGSVVSRNSRRPLSFQEVRELRRRGFRNQYKRSIRGERLLIPLAVRVARVADWYDGTALTGIASPTPLFFLGWVQDFELAQQLARAMADHVKMLKWNPMALRFGCHASEELGIADAGRIELEIEELPKRTDDLGRLHCTIVTEYRKLVSKLGVVVSRKEQGTANQAMSGLAAAPVRPGGPDANETAAPGGGQGGEAGSLVPAEIVARRRPVSRRIWSTTSTVYRLTVEAVVRAYRD